MKSSKTSIVMIGCAILSSVSFGDVFYAMAAESGSSLAQANHAMTWYGDEACTSTAGVVLPWATGASDHKYVILDCRKLQTSSAFPDVPVYFGTDGVTVGSKVSTCYEWNLNGSIELTFPNATVYSSYFKANSAGLTKFSGNYNCVKTTEPIKFGAVNADSNTPYRGVELAGSFSSAEDVEIQLPLTGGYANTCRGEARITGDFSAFKGAFRVTTFTPYSQKPNSLGWLDLSLSSASALGDVSYPRTDALTINGFTHLTMSDSVVQSGERGITLSLGASECACINAGANQVWTLQAPLYGSNGTLAKEGEGKVLLNGSVEITKIAVTAGTLELCEGFSFPEGLQIAVAAGATLRTHCGFSGITVNAEQGAIIQEVVYALPTTKDVDYGRWVLPTTEKDADGQFLWSDHLPAHGDADYIIDNGLYVVSGNTGWHDEMVFPGRSLSLENGRYITRAVVNVFSNLVLGAGSRVQTAGCAWGESPHRMLGRYTIKGTYDNPAQFVGGQDGSGQGRKTTFRIEGEVEGDGWLQFGGATVGADYHIYSTNFNFIGGVKLGVGTSESENIAIRFTHPNSFGGPLATFNYRSIDIESARGGLKPLSTMTFDVANRGVYFGETGSFIDTPGDVQFNMMNEIRVTKGFRKKGLGVLALGGSICFGSSGTTAPNGTNNRLAVEAGYVKAINTNGYVKLSLSFADGAGIAVDRTPLDPTVAEFGLYAPESGRFSASGKVLVRLDGADSDLAAQRPVRVTVCTVSADTPDMTDRFDFVRVPRYAARIMKETTEANGLIRYVAEWEPRGLALIIR